MIFLRINLPKFVQFKQYLRQIGTTISLNFQLNTKRHVPKAFLSPFVDGMVMAQTLARRYAIPPHTAPL